MTASYVLPNDETESDRLDMAHALITRVIGNKLYLAPVETPKVHRILDIGTGTGICKQTRFKQDPKYEALTLYNWQIIGNDLSAIQPLWVPPNVKFEIDDVESPWVGPKYDYIMCSNLNPGGWAEFQDMSVEYYSDDGSYKPEHFTYKWNQTFVQTLKAIGRDPAPGPQLEGWVRGHGGFNNVAHQKFKVPIGPWAKKRHYKDIGLLNLAQVLEGLEGFSLKLFCGVLGKSNEEVQSLLAGVRNELKTNAFHALFDIHVVFGQKPFTKE
ncbi:Secondary metabolism regulator LAE1 [Colletotrichum sp. SAR 10_98]|nr:Secondary metabolism regulator LAE1 [Colletotrichum sp. SAR 10_98]